MMIGDRYAFIIQYDIFTQEKENCYGPLVLWLNDVAYPKTSVNVNLKQCVKELIEALKNASDEKVIQVETSNNTPINCPVPELDAHGLKLMTQIINGRFRLYFLKDNNQLEYIEVPISYVHEIIQALEKIDWKRKQIDW